MRWIKRGFSGLAALLALVVISAVWVTWRSLPVTDSTIALVGPEAPIHIRRDSHGIPYISAESEGDASFALGYVHAQDRLFQMEFMRRLGAGRLAEVLGSQALGSDRFMRTLGLYRHAQANLSSLTPETRNILQRYADGVNAWLKNRTQPLPPEFQLLMYTPETWQPADSLVWQKLMSLSLAGNWRDELLRSELLQMLSPKQVEALWPDLEPGAHTTLATHQSEVPLGIAKVLMANIDAYAPPTLASNVWTIGGQHTASGKPLLASDPHLGFQAPIVWYLVRMEWPGGVRAGATTPGVPFTVIGHNNHTSWGMTTTHSDLQDLFIERLNTDGTYQTPDGPAEFETHLEIIQNRFSDPVNLNVRTTRHGPVVSDLAAFQTSGRASNTVLALSATMLRDDDRTANAIYELGRSRTVRDVKVALSQFDGPQQNFMYADVDGGIGFSAPALVPMRKAGNGTIPVPGWSGEYDWMGWVPYEELPHSLNPPSGRLVNANNRPVPEDYPHLIAASFPASYRAERIEQRLTDIRPESATAAEMLSIQLDHESAMAADLLPILLANSTPGSEQAEQAHGLLSVWDGAMDRNRPEPLIFLTWMDFVKRGLLADELGGLYPSYRGNRASLIRITLSGQNGWCDDISSSASETCQDVVSDALDDALSWLSERPENGGQPVEKWRWGTLHQARFTHSLFGLIPGLSPMTTVEIETDGSDHTINRGGYRSVRGEAPFQHSHGAGLRAIFDLSDLNQSQFMIAVGQSGHPASPHYDDLNRPWRDGDMLTLPKALSFPPQSTLQLRPAPIP